MSRIAVGKTCPRCKSKTVQRLKRKDWMRWLPASKYYRCSKCRTRFILLGDWFAWRTGSNPHKH